ncbi:hypothetical protein ABEX39_26565 [Bacillus albus]|uniref:hypothetical protein n=1 Tax=Bacillus albus TaxID=2026189 RepID=UPI003D244A74
MFYNKPLSYRMRPQTIEEIGPKAAPYRMLQYEHILFLLFYGPPGTEKTFLTFAIVNAAKKKVYEINIICAGEKNKSRY